MSTAVSQVIAAIYLTPRDFGVYAAASGILAACTFLRGGGTGNHVQTMTLSEFETDAGRFFRYSMLFTLGGAGLALAASLSIPSLMPTESEYGSDALRTTGVVLAAGFIASNFAVFPRAKLTASLRLQELSILDTTLGAIKVTATWLLARGGAGPATLPAALLACSLIESMWTWPRSELRARQLSAPSGWLRPTFQEMLLPLLMAVLSTLNSQTDSFLSSAFLPATVVGFYFFASQIAAQPTMLVGNTLRSIFTATTARVRGDAAKGDAAIREMFSGSMVFMPLVCMFIPAIFESFEKAVWGGKWADSRLPVLIMSTALVYPTTLQMICAPIAGLRDWKLAIRIDMVRAVSRILPAILACGWIVWRGVDESIAATVLASVVGAASALASGAEIYRILRRARMPRHSILYELYSTPLAALLSALAANGLAHSLIDSEVLRALLSMRAIAGIECVFSALLYCALAFILLRFGYTATLQRLIDALPDFMRPKARRLFVL